MIAFGAPHQHFEECESTNDLARAWILDPLAPAPQGALVTADHQTRGRGRRGRRWDAPPGDSALMSFILRPAIPIADAWQAAFFGALGVASALEPLDLVPRLKWPNDILLDGRKTAGVLVEAVPISEGWAAVLGIGLNVSQIEFPEADYPVPPTSLRRETGRELLPRDLVAAVAEALGRWDTVWSRDGFAPLLAAYREHLALGVRIRRGEETAELLGVGDDGQAEGRLPDGTFVRWASVD